MMNKIYDYKLKSSITNIYVGECCIGGRNDIISTVLGSCVAICLYDIDLQVGGMVHYLLPMEKVNNSHLNPMTYGDNSIKYLLESLNSRNDWKQNLVAKIFGGSNILKSEIKNNIGGMNIKFAKKELKKRNIKILSEDVGGQKSRRIYFFPGKNKVFLKEVI